VLKAPNACEKLLAWATCKRRGTFKYHFTKATLKNNARHQNLEQSKTWNI
jgi:hypothetical protein